MKLDAGFLIRNIAGEDVLVPVGSRVIDFKGLMTLTPVGAFIFRQLQEHKSEGEIIGEILNEYETDESTARADLEEFLARLRELGILTNE